MTRSGRPRARCRHGGQVREECLWDLHAASPTISDGVVLGSRAPGQVHGAEPGSSSRSSTMGSCNGWPLARSMGPRPKNIPSSIVAPARPFAQCRGCWPGTLEPPHDEVGGRERSTRRPCLWPTGHVAGCPWGMRRQPLPWRQSGVERSDSLSSPREREIIHLGGTHDKGTPYTTG